MKTKLYTLFAAGLLTLGGCKSMGMGGTSTAKLDPGPQTPAAQAQVSVDRKDRDPTGNSEVALEVDHLPPPSALGEELTTFVVWLTPEGSDEALNVGQLQYDPEDREGNLDIITPYNDFTIAVTAEPAANPLERSENVVVSGKIEMSKGRP